MIAALIDRLSQRVSLTHANHKRIAMGALWVAFFVMAAKLFVAAREMAIAWRYGVSGIVDAYQLALTITTWVPTILVGVATSVLVPRLVALHRNPDAYRGMVAELNGTLLVVGAAVTALTWISAPFLIGLLGEALQPATRELTEAMSLRLAPLALLTLMAGYFSIRLQARERYGYSFAEAIAALAITVALAAAPEDAAATPLIWGTLVGYLLQAVWLLHMTRQSDPPVGRVSLRHHSAEWGLVYGSLLIMLVGQVLISVSTPIDQAFAASLGEGAIATLGYANRIVSLIVGFGSIIVARALLPVLSEVAASGDHALGRSQSAKWSWVLLVFGIGVAVVGWIVAPWAVALLFERGAFTGQASATVAEVLRFGLIQLPFYFGGLALVQWFAASARYDLLLYVAAVAIAVKIGLNFLLVGSLGMAGIMAATAGMYATSYLVQLIYVTGTNDKSR